MHAAADPDHAHPCLCAYLTCPEINSLLFIIPKIDRKRTPAAARRALSGYFCEYNLFFCFGYIIYFVNRNGGVVCIMHLSLQALWLIAKKQKKIKIIVIS